MIFLRILASTRPKKRKKPNNIDTRTTNNQRALTMNKYFPDKRVVEVEHNHIRTYFNIIQNNISEQFIVKLNSKPTLPASSLPLPIKQAILSVRNTPSMPTGKLAMTFKSTAK